MKQFLLIECWIENRMGEIYIHVITTESTGVYNILLLQQGLRNVFISDQAKLYSEHYSIEYVGGR